MNKLDEARDKAVGRVGSGYVRTLEEAGLVIAPADMMQTRAGNLLAKGAFFVVVRDDEPYFGQVYSTIREQERLQGTWTADDEQQYRDKLGDDYVDRKCYVARCPLCRVIVGAIVDSPSRREDIAKFLSEMILDGWIVQRMVSDVAREQFGTCECHENHYD
jgi:hypothetical protein